MPFAEVAVNTTVPVSQAFTYRIPNDLPVEVGHAVYVPFGQQTLQGIVLEVTPTPAFAEARDIQALIDPQPLLSPERAALARWLADYYLAPLFNCVSLMLPPGFKRKPLTYLRSLVTADQLSNLVLSDHGREAMAYVLANQPVELSDLRKVMRLGSRSNVVASLFNRRLLERSYELARPKVRPKTVPQIRLVVSTNQAREAGQVMRANGQARSARQAAVLEALLEEGSLPLSQVRARTQLTPAALRELIDQGLVAVEDVAVLRDPLAGRIYPQRPPPVLTPEQNKVYEVIAQALTNAVAGQRQAPFLLHGVTGSGKTEVYLRALDKAVALGKRGIVLVPEISLTPQTVRRFAERFPGQVAVMHSSLSLGEHYDMWHEVRQGRYAVVIGPRGAAFAPQPDLGLVIIDEEHEWTYKQEEQAPRYHARKVAEKLCELTGAVLVLGSATPDVESYQRTQSGRLHLLELRQRVQPVCPPASAPAGEPSVAPSSPPQIDIVDLKTELRAGNRSIFSRSLAEALKATLAAGEQAILFLNRRGTASFVQCRDCGHVPACSRCAVSLTYHAPEGRLVCHQCHRQKRMPASCPSCGSPRIRLLGIGTERVEAEVQRAFPNARTLRWDRDVARGHGAHESILASFLAHEADVLIGTQMIAKGLDIPLVTLVGVISADISLHLPDFRSGERAFQLLQQVAGRAGRGTRGGRVIIQTYTPDHYAVQAAARHDYLGFFQQEAEFRRRLGYPPFARLAQLTFAHVAARYAQEEAFRLTRLLKLERDRRGIPNLDVLGPAPAFISRLRGRYRWQVLLRGSDPSELLRDFSFPQGWSIDIDPVSLL